MLPTVLLFTERHPRYVALVGLALFLMGVVLYGFQQVNSKNTPVTQISDSDEVNLVMSPEIQEKIKLQGMMSEIISTRDLTQCDRFGDSSNKVVCTNSIAIALASETGDVSYCDRLDGEKVSREDCKNEIPFQSSLVNGDITICDQLADIERRERCTDSFYEVLARYKDDITICDQYSGETVILCRDRFLVMKALGHSGEGVSCSQITDETLRSDCEFLVKPRPVFSDMTESTCPLFKSGFLKQVCESPKQTVLSVTDTIGIYPQ